DIHLPPADKQPTARSRGMALTGPDSPSRYDASSLPAPPAQPGGFYASRGKSAMDLAAKLFVAGSDPHGDVAAVHLHLRLHGAAAHLAVFDVAGRACRFVDHQLDGFAAVRAGGADGFRHGDAPVRQAGKLRSGC